MPGEANMSHPVKWAWVVKSEEEDTEMSDLMHAVEDCRTQLQFLMGRISKYMDNMEVSAMTTSPHTWEGCRNSQQWPLQLSEFSSTGTGMRRSM